MIGPNYDGNGNLSTKVTIEASSLTRWPRMPRNVLRLREDLGGRKIHRAILRIYNGRRSRLALRRRTSRLTPDQPEVS